MLAVFTIPVTVDLATRRVLFIAGVPQVVLSHSANRDNECGRDGAAEQVHCDANAVEYRCRQAANYPVA